MEEKLKDLQSKLQGEEHEKKALESKYSEVNTKVSTVQDELEKRTKEIANLADEKAEIDRIKGEAEQYRIELEKERKSLKEMQTQNVRLKSLVKIGEDSIKAEQTRIGELQEQLRLRNNSVSASTPCLTSNGSSPLKNSSNSLDVANEAVSK
jgi:chromosome segregation ATPase